MLQCIIIINEFNNYYIYVVVGILLTLTSVYLTNLIVYVSPELFANGRLYIV